MPLRMPAQRSQQRQPQQQGERSAAHSSGINKPYAPPRAAQQSSSDFYDAQQALGGVMSVQEEEDDDDEQYWRDDAALGSGAGEWEDALLETEFVTSDDAAIGAFRPEVDRLEADVTLDRYRPFHEWHSVGCAARCSLESRPAARSF